jgi:hypothetical protein
MVLLFATSRRPPEGAAAAGAALIGAGFAVLALVVAHYATRFRHVCCYVGQDGVARLVCSGGRDRLVRREVFRFRDAAELRATQTEEFVNGVYAGTHWKFTWADVGGRERFALRGTHYSRQGSPPPADPYHFARAAEMAWTYYLLGDAGRQVELAGGVRFNVRGGQWIRLGPGVLSADLGAGPVEWRAEEIAGARVERGAVRILRRDAREGWFSSSGVLQFAFADLANAQLFFHLLGRLVGVPVS